MHPPYQQPTPYDSVFIRHAQSNFNKGQWDYVSEHNPPTSDWLQLTQLQPFNKAVTYNPIYIDPHITQYGIQQAKEQMDPKEFDLILVSPQLRALQTCELIFGKENKNVVVHPLVTQVVRYSCDVSHVMAEKMALFPWYDFEEMKNWTDEWYFEVLSQQKRQILKSHFEQHEIHDFKGRQLAVIGLLSNGTISETAKELRERVGRLKELIRSIKHSRGAKKVAVVSHHYTTQCLLAPGFDEQGNVVGIGEIVNGRPYFRRLGEVLGVK